MTRFAALLTCALCLVPLASTQPPRSQLAWSYDFEKPGVEANWVVRGQIDARRVPASELPGPPQPGHVLQVKAATGSLLSTRPGEVPADWLDCASIAFRILRPAEAAEQTPIEVFVMEAGTPYFVREVRLNGQGWQRVRLPLKWFRPGSIGLPNWRRIERLVFSFPREAELVLDDIELERGQTPKAAEPTMADLADLAFPGASARSLQLVQKPHVRLLSNAPALDVPMLDRHLARVESALRGKLSFLPAADSPPWLLIFQAEAEYRAFVPRLAERYGARAHRPTASGYTLLGYALATWDAQRGSLRSVYTHEYVHALLERTAGVANGGEWFQEGLATLFQAEFHPDFNLPASVRQHHTQPRNWQELCSGQPLRLQDYWQAASLCDCLLNHPRHKEKLPKLVEALRQSRSTDLTPHLGSVFGTNWGELSVAWQLHCRNVYGAQR